MSVEFCALAMSGRFMVMVATAPSTTYRIVSKFSAISPILPESPILPSPARLADAQPRGSPRTRSPTSVRWISLVPAKMDDAW